MGKSSGTYDFSGWVTKNDLMCTDGRTIRKDAFKECDGRTVPLVWQHQHNAPDNVLGHVKLENRPEGVYGYGSFNSSDNAQYAKELVQHGDIKSLSIHANQLKQQGGNVMHGVIREVSLVLAGANPGATIDFPVILHSDGSYGEAEDEAIISQCIDISLDENEEIEHADEEPAKKEETNVAKGEDKTVKDVLDGLTEDQTRLLAFLIAEALKKETGEEDEDEEVSHADGDGPTVEEVFKTLTEEQKKVFYYIIGKAVESAKEDKNKTENEATHSYDGGNDYMKHNVFEGDATDTQGEALSHADQLTIIKDTKKYGSLKESFLAHADDYGIQDIEWLFPEVHNLNTTPEFIKRDTGWVSKVLGATHHTPFSRIKSTFADIREDEARAKGYIKGKLKKEEVFSLLKRTTDPQTVYKKQKIDRDDQIDITDFDVVSWIKAEMRMMLDEELARAILIGDGRLASDDDKISEDHIRSVANDASLYSVPVTVTEVETEPFAKTFIKAVINSRKDYKGSGNPTLYTTEDMVAQMLLLEDGIGHFMYTSETQLATVLRVKEIVTVPVMTDQVGIIVNLQDYNVGADKGGAVSMFDDFDIDYNQMKYLIETRCSGALVKPYSALVFTAADGD